jgi:hypothetical protein
MAITSGTGKDICVTVGLRIAKLRADRGMTQQVLADLNFSRAVNAAL